jgi:hypothetical protein
VGEGGGASLTNLRGQIPPGKRSLRLLAGCSGNGDGGPASRRLQGRGCGARSPRGTPVEIGDNKHPVLARFVWDIIQLPGAKADAVTEGRANFPEASENSAPVDGP